MKRLSKIMHMYNSNSVLRRLVSTIVEALVIVTHQFLFRYFLNLFLPSILVSFPSLNVILLPIHICLRPCSFIDIPFIDLPSFLTIRISPVQIFI